MKNKKKTKWCCFANTTRYYTPFAFLSDFTLPSGIHPTHPLPLSPSNPLSMPFSPTFSLTPFLLPSLRPLFNPSSTLLLFLFPNIFNLCLGAMRPPPPSHPRPRHTLLPSRCTAVATRNCTYKRVVYCYRGTRLWCEKRESIKLVGGGEARGGEAPICEFAGSKVCRGSREGVAAAAAAERRKAKWQESWPALSKDSSVTR